MEKDIFTPAWERLKPKDKVLVTASSWPATWDYAARKERFGQIKNFIESEFGLTAVIPEYLLDEPFDGDYAHDAQHRANNDTLATKNSQIKLIWNLNGGLGALESSRLFDEWRKQNPDALQDRIPEIGFSDVTIKLLRKGQPYSYYDKEGRLKNLSGIISPFYGMTLMRALPRPEDSEEMQKTKKKWIKEFKSLFLEGYEKNPQTTFEKNYSLFPLNDIASNSDQLIIGKTLGGHTSRITASLGTEWEIAKNFTGLNDDGIILCLEADDVQELKSFLSHLKKTPVWSKVKAIAVGKIATLEKRFTKESGEFYEPKIKAELIKLANKFDKPILGGLPIGYTLDNTFLPMLTTSSIKVFDGGKNADFKVNIFRDNEDIEKVHTPFNPKPDKRFPFSRKEHLFQKKMNQYNIDFIKKNLLFSLNDAACKMDSLEAVSIVGGDLGSEQSKLGTSDQLHTKNKVIFFHADLRNADKVLLLEGDNTSPSYYCSLVKATVTRMLAHMNEAGIFTDAKALIIGDIIAPSDVSSKSEAYIREFNRHIKIFLQEEGINLPVFRAIGHQAFPSRFSIENMDMKRTGGGNRFTLEKADKVKNASTSISKS